MRRSTLHDELDRAAVPDVQRRIRGQDDEVGQLPYFDGADVRLPAQRELTSVAEPNIGGSSVARQPVRRRARPKSAGFCMDMPPAS